MMRERDKVKIKEDRNEAGSDEARKRWGKEKMRRGRDNARRRLDE